MVTCLEKQLARHTHAGLVIKPCPLPLQPFPISLYLHDRFHRDPGNQWLRLAFAALCEPGKSSKMP
ncbi:MAG: bacterial regulatory helix-turn-helix protein LysR family protein [Betaproteobacteria bacterium]|nr:bacterial regulatory helix-turn-helix protein LysR family protein [Betaproteobacteria bacterium]